MTEPKETLKPCPFCGDSLHKMSEGMGYFHSKKNCTLSDFQMLADGYSEERWNTRADAAENAALREKLAVARETLTYIWETSPNLHDVGRARDALDALTGGDNAEG